MAVLSDGSGWMLNGDLGLWMCLQPGAGHPAGAAPRPGGVALSGDAERLRSGSAAALSAGPPPRLALPGPDAPLWRRKEAEMQARVCACACVVYVVLVLLLAAVHLHSLW